MLKPKSVQARKRKPVLGLNVDDEELKHLENIVLGDGDEIFEKEPSREAFEEDVPKEKTKLPAWVDEADTVDDQTINKACKMKQSQQFREIKFHRAAKKPKWANYVQKSDENDILKRSGNIIEKTDSLQQHTIDIKKLNDLNSQTYNEGNITAIKFHPKSTVALVAGLSGVISLFQVDGKENIKLQSTKYKRFPIECASFVNNGEEYIVGSGFSTHFYTFNLMTGQSFKMNQIKLDRLSNMKKFIVSPDDKYIAVIGLSGKIFLLSGRTKECVDYFQMNSCVKAVSFSQDGSMLYSHTADGEVYIWDIRAKKCLQKFIDDGCLAGTAIDVSSNNSLFTCGQTTGVVNVYDVNKVMSNQYKPLKAFYNLVTPITNVKFNPTSELLFMSSVHKQRAVRLVHLSSLSVYSNFPEFQGKISHVTCVDFSPNSGYLSFGDSRKVAHLYRLGYYGNY